MGQTGPVALPWERAEIRVGEETSYSLHPCHSPSGPLPTSVNIKEDNASIRRLLKNTTVTALYKCVRLYYQ